MCIRDRYIENYIQTMRNLKEFGVKVICYNFMPAFDWTRTDLFHPLPDGSTALFYEKDLIQDDPRAMADYILKNLNGMTFPGWEPERMARLDELFEMYRPVTKEKLWENLKYFLEKLMPVCHECDIKTVSYTHLPGVLHSGRADPFPGGIYPLIITKVLNPKSAPKQGRFFFFNK